MYSSNHFYFNRSYYWFVGEKFRLLWLSSCTFYGECREGDNTHLTGAPYHPSTNGAAGRLVQSFTQSLKKSSLPSKSTLQKFLMQYCQTPLDSYYSPNEVLNEGQIFASRTPGSRRPLTSRKGNKPGKLPSPNRWNTTTQCPS